MTESQRPPKNERSRLRVLIEDRDGRLFMIFLLWLICGAAAEFFLERADQIVLSGLAQLMVALSGMYIGFDLMIWPRRYWYRKVNVPMLNSLGGFLFFVVNLVIGLGTLRNLVVSIK